jgi:hypothetical protein
MPLFNVVGINCLHKNFSVAFGLSVQETEEDFHWHLTCLKRLQVSHSIDDPGVIISDFCRGFKKAALVVYPNTPQQMCVWHIMKNVLYHLGQKWVQEGVDEPLATAIPVVTSDLDGPGPDPPSYKPAANNEENDEGEEDPDEAADEAIANSLTQRQDSVEEQCQDLGKCQDFVECQGANTDSGLGLDDRGRPKRYFENSKDGFMKAWSKVVYADEKDVFERAWDLLCSEFSAQTCTFFPFFWAEVIATH